MEAFSHPHHISFLHRGLFKKAFLLHYSTNNQSSIHNNSNAAIPLVGLFVMKTVFIIVSNVYSFAYGLFPLRKLEHIPEEQNRHEQSVQVETRNKNKVCSKN